jgi:group I intron endonuclease
MVIYLITNNINGKIYIGKSINSTEDYYGSGISINRAINKYGKKNFTKKILEKCDNINDLNEKEIFWIKYYDSTNRDIGYNIAEGGNGGNTRIGYTESEMVKYKNKISEGLKKSEKYLKSLETKKNKKRPKHSEVMKKLYQDGKLCVGKNTPKPTKETRKKISEKNKGKKRTEETKERIAKSKFKKVYMFDTDNHLLNEFKSIGDASEKCEINRCCISDVCNGRQKTAGGYRWSFDSKI